MRFGPARFDLCHSSYIHTERLNILVKKMFSFDKGFGYSLQLDQMFNAELMKWVLLNGL
jgi:hypothetical protein